jgi:hypothetical protein
MVGFTLADGSTVGIAAVDEKSSRIISRLSKAMQLQPFQAPTYQLLVMTDDGGDRIDHAPVDSGRLVPVSLHTLPIVDNVTFVDFVSPALRCEGLMNQLLQIALVIARQAQNKGGILLHGALIERDGCGVTLAGPGRVGKTTASRRLPASWRSLSDDATLIIRDEQGNYWAHPWPTWSNFMSDGPGGTWDVEHAVPLKAIFFLQQALQNRVEPVAPGQSVCLLVELAEHTSWSMSHRLANYERRAILLQRFENICDLVKDVPCYNLHLSLDGAFWKEIERVIIEHSCKGT